jgi:hypothetical protein
MPIDPRIPLAAQAPQMPNVMESMGRVQSLKNMAQQNRMNDLNLQTGQLNLEETRKRLDATEKARKIMSEEKDARKAAKRIMKEVGPYGLEVAQEVANFDAALSTMDENQLKATGERLKMIGSAINPIRDMPEEQRAAAYDAALKQLVANGIIKQEDIGAKFPAAYPGAETLDMMANSAVSVENQYRSAVAAQRAKAYADNIASLAKQRDDKANIDWVQYELDVRDLERKLASDEMLDSRERRKLEAQLKQHQDTLRQRAIEERGRNQRFEQGEQGEMDRLNVREEGLMDRLKFREEAIWERQQALQKDYKPEQITAAYQRSMEFVAGKNATLEDLDDDEIEAVNNLAQAALQLESVEAGKTQGMKLLGIRYGRDVTVTPNGPANPQGGAASTRETTRTTTERPVGQAKPAPPKVGEIRDGYRFKGGNPADPNSWEKVR